MLVSATSTYCVWVLYRSLLILYLRKRSILLALAQQAQYIDFSENLPQLVSLKTCEVL